ncbi:unnamed protein product [Rotaria sp. Silwood1]|nr:unnamed protein product [Rotaria sp. Silwood1]
MQVCSSTVISSEFTTLLYGYGTAANSYSQLDRPLLSKQLQNLNLLCADAMGYIKYGLVDLSENIFITSTTLSHRAFIETVNQTINDYKSLFRAEAIRVVNFLVLLLYNNFIPTSFNTDWTLEYGDESNSFLIRSIPRTFDNSTCNCAVSSTCQQPLRIGPSDLILPGLVIGCSPMEGLRMSTLECFFSSDCISTIINYLDYYTQIDGSPPVNFTPPKTPPIVIASLNTSLSTRFLPSTQIGELIHEMFLEQLTNVISYEKYYATCAPSVCRYEYVERSNILYIVTTLLGLYGAVSVGLRLLIWNSLRIYHKIKNYFHYHNAAIQPQTSIITH